MARFHDVVAAHHRESDAVLVASREPCITIAAEEVRRVRGRSFRVVTPSDLPKLEVRDSWMMAVLLCPGDEATSVVAWVRSKDRDPRRVLFYLHPSTDAPKAFRSWREAGFHVHAVWTVSDWKGLHKHLGAHWNLRIFDDFRHREP